MESSAVAAMRCTRPHGGERWTSSWGLEPRRRRRCGGAGAAAGGGRRRGAGGGAAWRGEVDVLVGTRAAALVPVWRLGAVCVADEPNEAHRAAPGYAGAGLPGRGSAAPGG